MGLGAERTLEQILFARGRAEVVNDPEAAARTGMALRNAVAARHRTRAQRRAPRPVETHVGVDIDAVRLGKIGEPQRDAEQLVVELGVIGRVGQPVAAQDGIGGPGQRPRAVRQRQNERLGIGRLKHLPLARGPAQILQAERQDRAIGIDRVQRVRLGCGRQRVEQLGDAMAGGRKVFAADACVVESDERHEAQIACAVALGAQRFLDEALGSRRPDGFAAGAVLRFRR